MNLKAGLIVLTSIVFSDAGKAETHSEGLHCVEKYFHIKSAVAPGDNVLVDIAPDDATQVLKDIAARSEKNLDPKAVACEQVLKASAFQPWSDDGLPANLQALQYIIYNPNWIQEILGNNRDMVVFILGHELGHIINGDVAQARVDAVSDKSKNPARLEMERKADYAGACALAQVGGTWDALEDLIPRIRGIKDVNYPSGEESLDIARIAFSACGGQLDPDPKVTTNVVYWYKRADGGKVVKALNEIGAHIQVKQSGVVNGVDYSDRDTDSVVCHLDTSVAFTRRIALSLYDAGIKLRGISAADPANQFITNTITIESAAKGRSILSRHQIVDLVSCPSIRDPTYGRGR